MKIYMPKSGCNICGQRVREAQTAAGWTQEQLAAKLQVAGLQIGQMAVSRIETGKRIVPDYELPKIAEVLGVTVDWLLKKI